MVRAKTFVVVLPTLSAACSVKVKEPLPAGVPLRIPDEEFSIKPAGSAVDVQVYGGSPPAAAKVWEYGFPVVAGGSGEAVEIVMVDDLNERTNCFVVVARALSVT